MKIIRYQDLVNMAERVLDMMEVSANSGDYEEGMYDGALSLFENINTIPVCDLEDGNLIRSKKVYG